MNFVLNLQYGFVNYALELLVVKTFGEETWEKIKYDYMFWYFIFKSSADISSNTRKDADVTIEGQFLVRQIYEDAVTYNLIGAAVNLLRK